MEIDNIIIDEVKEDVKFLDVAKDKLIAAATEKILPMVKDFATNELAPAVVDVVKDIATNDLLPIVSDKFAGKFTKK